MDAKIFSIFPYRSIRYALFGLGRECFTLLLGNKTTLFSMVKHTLGPLDSFPPHFSSTSNWLLTPPAVHLCCWHIRTNPEIREKHLLASLTPSQHLWSQPASHLYRPWQLQSFTPCSLVSAAVPQILKKFSDIIPYSYRILKTVMHTKGKIV